VDKADTELIFPPRVIPVLRDLRGDFWKDLVDEVVQSEDIEINRLAFVLLMARMGGCASCHSDSFRAMRGCTQCSKQTIRRYRGTDEELNDLFLEARQDMEAFMKNNEDEV
jgi:hypothetical protein